MSLKGYSEIYGQSGWWSSMNWMDVGRAVRRLQERIYNAIRDGNEHRAKELMKLLARSESAKLLAIYKVTQQNKGRLTSGIDGKAYATAEDRANLSQEPFNYHAWRFQPALRRYIPKGKAHRSKSVKTPAERRPLSIMTIKDRAMATIISLALEAGWEALMEPNVMGYRMGRCTQDAIQVIVKALSKGSPVVLDADIKSFFDNVTHEAILDRVWCFRDVVKRALTAGIVENGNLTRTTRGIMQGSPLSPVLANIALHGMETELEAIPGVTVVRYADDLVAVVPTKCTTEVEVEPKLSRFLAVRGLALKPEKTRIVTKQEGFDFLGFTVAKPRLKLLVKPRKKNVHEFLEHVKEIIRTNKQAEQRNLIALLNPVINGWARYYQYSSAYRTFSHVDAEIWRALWRWAKRRHPGKNRGWILHRYFGQGGTRSWAFRDEDTGYTLAKAGDMRHREYTFVIGGKSVLDKACPSRKAWASQVNEGGVRDAYC
jgi:RNA-directed DNA polymerase